MELGAPHLGSALGPATWGSGPGFRVRVKFRVRAESRFRIGLRVRVGFRVRVGLRVRALRKNKRHESGYALVKDVLVFFEIERNQKSPNTLYKYKRLLERLS